MQDTSNNQNTFSIWIETSTSENLGIAATNLTQLWFQNNLIDERLICDFEIPTLSDLLVAESDTQYLGLAVYPNERVSIPFVTTFANSINLAEISLEVWVNCTNGAGIIFSQNIVETIEVNNAESTEQPNQ